MENQQKNELRFCQADELIKALHIMDNNELKFMFYALSERKLGDTKIETTFDDVLSKLKIEYGGKQTKVYKKAIESIIRKSVMTVEMTADRLPIESRGNLKPNETVLVSGALMGAMLWPDNRLEIKFFPEFIPMLDDLRHNYTWIYLEQIARLNGKYSPRIYEWLKMQLKDKDECNFIWYLDIDSKEAPGIRQWLNIGDKYSVWQDFKKRVIKPSLDEINECTSDIQVSFKPLRNGRRTPVYALDMHIEAKHKANKIAQKKSKKKKDKVELDEKFYPQAEEKSTEEIQKEMLELQKKLKEGSL